MQRIFGLDEDLLVSQEIICSTVSKSKQINKYHIDTWYVFLHAFLGFERSKAETMNFQALNINLLFLQSQKVAQVQTSNICITVICPMTEFNNSNYREKTDDVTDIKKTVR